ncbi:ImmA/IrrE family metallo-endopeptidase [Halalkalibacter okhensis]|uniref:ImmA/IrrE family metallo-endopeptidase n=1 Tax=Halalkalibacter okhensis TaxID=333138 RepID=UPI000690BB57|nr:ImmA/IrrE family metallo-endopeptidase [Halalkalibacter okhensis]
MKQKYTSSFVPIIYKNDFDIVASEFLKKYCPEALEKPMPVPILEIAEKKIQLKVIRTERLSKSLDIIGAITLCDGIIDIYDSTTKEYMGLKVQKGTVFVDSYINHSGRENNTLAHECVHWYKHRPYFIHQSKKEDTFAIAFRCPVRRIQDNEYNSWSDAEWMEWQASGIAPRILMPKEMVKIKIRELVTFYGSSEIGINRITVLQNIIDDLAEFFCVSKQSAKIRMIELGYEEAKEIDSEENDDYIQSLNNRSNQDTGNISLMGNHTQKIGLNDAFEEYLKNVRFQEIIKSGQFSYVDGYFVINEDKYIKLRNNGKRELTQYAKDNLIECVLNFSYKLKSSYDPQGVQHKIDLMYRLQYSTDYKRLPFYASNPQNDAVFDKAEALRNLREEFDAKYEETKKYTKTFSEKVYEIIEMKKWNSAIFKDKTLLDDMAFSRIKNKKDKAPNLKTVITICVGLDLDLSMTNELLKLAGHSLTSSREHSAYSYIITAFSGCSIDERNEVLESLGVTPLGTRSREK